jgi:hypothetical protein
LASVARKIAERLEMGAPAEKAKKLLTDAYLLAGLGVKRSIAAQIFRGVLCKNQILTWPSLTKDARSKRSSSFCGWENAALVSLARPRVCTSSDY